MLANMIAGIVALRFRVEVQTGITPFRVLFGGGRGCGGTSTHARAEVSVHTTPPILFVRNSIGTEYRDA